MRSELRDQILVVKSALARLTELDAEPAIDVRSAISSEFESLKELPATLAALKKLEMEFVFIENTSKISSLYKEIGERKEEIRRAQENLLVR